jgi:hypothetical protein
MAAIEQNRLLPSGYDVFTTGKLTIAALHDPEDGVLSLSLDTSEALQLKTGEFVLAHGLGGRRTILKVRTDEGKTSNAPLAYISYSTCETLGIESGDRISLSSVRGLEQVCPCTQLVA